jgi:DNA-binding phage protein
MSFSNPEHRNKALNRIREKVAAGLYIPGNRFVVPTKGDPLVLQIFRTMRSRNMSITEMSKRSGVAETTIRRWLAGRSPQFRNVQAVANTLGYEFTLVKSNR